MRGQKGTLINREVASGKAAHPVPLKVIVATKVPHLTHAKAASLQTWGNGLLHAFWHDNLGLWEGEGWTSRASVVGLCQSRLKGRSNNRF